MAILMFFLRWVGRTCESERLSRSDHVTEQESGSPSTRRTEAWEKWAQRVTPVPPRKIRREENKAIKIKKNLNFIIIKGIRSLASKPNRFFSGSQLPKNPLSKIAKKSQIPGNGIFVGWDFPKKHLWLRLRAVKHEIFEILDLLLVFSNGHFRRRESVESIEKVKKPKKEKLKLSSRDCSDSPVRVSYTIIITL